MKKSDGEWRSGEIEEDAPIRPVYSKTEGTRFHVAQVHDRDGSGLYHVTHHSIAHPFTFPHSDTHSHYRSQGFKSKHQAIEHLHSYVEKGKMKKTEGAVAGKSYGDLRKAEGAEYKKVGEIHHADHGKMSDVWQHQATNRYHHEDQHGGYPDEKGHPTLSHALVSYKKMHAAFNQVEGDMSHDDAHADSAKLTLKKCA